MITSQENQMPHLNETKEGYPIWNDKEMVSLLFAVICEKCHLSSDELILRGGSTFIALSDRPHRVAKMIPGGAQAFANFFKHSDFENIPPNVVFAGTGAEGREGYGVFVIGEPQSDDGSVRIPIQSVLEGESTLHEGEYSKVSLFVDNVWDTIGGVMEAAGGAIVTGVTVAGGIAGGLTVGGACEVTTAIETAGLSTPFCVAAGAAAGAAIGGGLGGGVAGIGAGIKSIGGDKG
jgi:hypothetical protein